MSGLRGREKGLSNKEVTEKYSVPRNTISSRVKNKSKYYAALEQLSNNRKKLSSSDSERVDFVC